MAYFRAMDENCPMPVSKIQPPVVEELCYMQVRRAKSTVDWLLYAYGEGNSEAIYSCYIEAIVAIDIGDVESMCTKDALIEGWEAMTESSLGRHIDM